MFWIGVLIISPIWGAVSTQLFLQAWLATAGIVVSLIGVVRGAVPRRDTLMQLGIAVFQLLLWSMLLRGGFWVIQDWLQFGASTGENVVYWIFAAFSAAYMIPQIPRSLRRAWHFAMTPGFLERETIARRAT